MSIKLTLWQHIQLRVWGHVFLRWEKPPGYTDYVPIYAVKCKTHGVYEDMPHGFTEYFECPKCRSFSHRVKT